MKQKHLLLSLFLCFGPLALGQLSSVAAAGDLELLSLENKMSYWPEQVRLKEPVKVKLNDGKLATIPADYVVDLISVRREGVEVEVTIRGNSMRFLVAGEKTDVLARAQQERDKQARMPSRTAPAAVSPQTRPAYDRNRSTPGSPVIASSHGGFSGATQFTKNLRGDLVEYKGGSFRPYSASALAKKDFIVLYFSASWCGPCKRFTPGLVNFYNQYGSGFDSKFEIVLVSRDRSEASMRSYINSFDMPWPAIEYAKTEGHEVEKFSGKGIPCLVLLDKSGKVLSHSYENGKYVGPKKVLKDLAQLL